MKLKDCQKQSYTKYIKIIFLKKKIIIDFDGIKGFHAEPGYKGIKSSIMWEIKDCVQGNGSIRLTFTTRNSGYGVGLFKKRISSIDIRGKTFEVFVKPLKGKQFGWGVIFTDNKNRITEEYRVFHMKINQWNRFVIKEGIGCQVYCNGILVTKKGWFRINPEGDKSNIVKIGFRAMSGANTTQCSMLWDAMSMTE